MFASRRRKGIGWKFSITRNNFICGFLKALARENVYNFLPLKIKIILVFRTVCPVNRRLQAAFVSNDKIPRILRKLNQGQVFGDVGTLLQSTYRASVRTRTHIELLSIAWTDLIKVIKFYPGIRRRAHEHAFQVHGVDVEDLRAAS